MLAQLLELKGLRATAASQASLELVAQQGATAVCISALPPAALSHARNLCKRLCARFPGLPVVAGLWASKADSSKSRDRLGCDGPVKLVTSLAAAMGEIQQMVQPVPLEHPVVVADDDTKRLAPALAAG